MADTDATAAIGRELRPFELVGCNQLPVEQSNPAAPPPTRVMPRVADTTSTSASDSADYPVVQGLTITLAMLVSATFLLTDLVLVQACLDLPGTR